MAKNVFQTDKLKVAVVGDSPLVTSGFGNVIRMAIEGFVEVGFDVHVLGALDIKYDPIKIKSLPYTYWPVNAHDAMADAVLNEFLDYTNPDRIFAVWDGGTLGRKVHIMRTNNTTASVPIVVYFPIEGLPIFPAILEMCNKTENKITYCKFGQKELIRLGAENVFQAYHGYNHAPVEAFTWEEKQQLKRVFGFADRFVVGMVGVNKRTNNQPKIIEAAQYVKDDVLIYLHCKGFDGHIMGGYDLTWMPKYYGVEDKVLLKSDTAKTYKYYYGPYKDELLTKDVLLNMRPPNNKEACQALWNKVPYVIKINTFDVLLDASSVQGFSLPILEAIMCGTPVITVDDGCARSEVYGDVCYMIKPFEDFYSMWHLGVKLVEVTPKQIADAINDWYDHYKYFYTKYQIPAYEKFKSWTWENAQKLFNRLVEFGV